MRGNVHGPWYEGEGRVVEDAATIERILGAMRKKYGWQAAVGNFFARISGRMKTRAYLEVTVSGPAAA
jgi:hypothetical protein